MSMATYNRPPWSRTLTALRVAGQGLLLTFLAATAYVWIWVAAVLIETPPPEERCFTAADHSHNYCRTQRHWSHQ
ncbi:MAG: hypothetical protein ACOC0Q_07370 [Wenzhouxiangella sp.]